jgi:hypothetical protein
VRLSVLVLAVTLGVVSAPALAAYLSTPWGVFGQAGDGVAIREMCCRDIKRW